ncbi:MAG: HAD family hydrolase [Deltaproteobacteria bacterium]|nr:MAG: HAD family hydrolase [Deltaproteobacteria bacterium]
MTTLRTLLSRPPKLVFLDCDGVIYDTNRLKCDAYRHALAGYPEAEVDAVVAHHKATGGVSRFVKLRRFFTELHPVADVEAALAPALEAFSDYSREGYAHLAPRPEALAFAAHHGGPARVYVVSGGSEAELRDVFARAGIADRFTAILGSPLTKRDHLEAVLAERGVAARDALFIGDGWADWDTTRALGVPFVFLAEMSEWHDGPDIVRGSPDTAVAATWEELLDAAGIPAA